MEGIPTPERIPTKEEILAELKEKGLNEETLALVTKWTEAKEAEVKTARDTLLLNVERIDFYKAVGDGDGELECAQEAYENAYREGEFDICDSLQILYPNLGK
jgi:hypothetical protein